MDTILDNTPPAEWVEALDRGLADIEAGRIVPMEPVLSRLRAAIARMETQQQGQEARATRKA
jgi:predicted transcriptional regulator